MALAPTQKSIRVFASVSRHLSFQAAAEELGVTPTAISHQIRNLELRAGLRLFNRSSNGVSLTEKGLRFAEVVVPAIDEINLAYERLTSTNPREKITLGAGPIVASRWLAPRLPEFFARHPEVDLQIINSPTQIWQRTREFDLAIAWGEGNWPGLCSDKLLDVHLVPVLSPALADDLSPQSPQDLLHAPLLHHRNSSEWRDWFRQSGVEVGDLEGTSVDDTNVAVQAALAGTGVFLGVREFLDNEISTGRLVCPFSNALKPSASYFIAQSKSSENETVEKLKVWLLECTGQN